MIRAIVLSFIMLFVTDFAHAADVNHDSHPLSAEEYELFLPLVCSHSQKVMPSAPPYSALYPNSYKHHCRNIIGYPNDPGNQERMNRHKHDKDISLTAVAYGSFTQVQADEAYVSYDGGFEDHASLFGGGILFQRQNKKWHVVEWFPAERRENCIALPSTGLQEMMCLDRDGHPDRSVDSIGLTLTAQDIEDHNQSSRQLKPTYTLSRAVYAVRDNNFGDCDDMRNRRNDDITDNNDPCINHLKDLGLLIEIDDLKRSHQTGAFAEATAVYATPNDADKACKATCYLDAPQKNGKIYFALDGTMIKVIMPEGLNLQSAQRQ